MFASASWGRIACPCDVSTVTRPKGSSYNAQLAIAPKLTAGGRFGTQGPRLSLEGAHEPQAFRWDEFRWRFPEFSHSPL